jgi:hypothetical protein
VCSFQTHGKCKPVQCIILSVCCVSVGGEMEVIHCRDEAILPALSVSYPLLWALLSSPHFNTCLYSLRSSLFCRRTLSLYPFPVILLFNISLSLYSSPFVTSQLSEPLCLLQPVHSGQQVTFFMPMSERDQVSEPTGLLFIPQMIHEYGAKVEWYCQGKPNNSDKTCPSAILSTINPTWTSQSANPGL